jgi:hypothetical protein
MEVWAHWYTPAHIVGGWRWKLKHREIAELLDARPATDAEAARETEEAESPDSGVPVLPETVDVASGALVAEHAASVAVAPADGAATEAARDPSSIMDLVDEVFDSKREPANIFRKIGQLARF